MANWRKLAFVVKDFVNKNKITNHYKEIKAHFEENYSSQKELKMLLHHAKYQVPFYEKFDSLTEFPVVDKSMIKLELSNFKAKNFAGKKLISMTTSGSTGTPFTVYQDANKKTRNHADTLYFGELAGYELGNKLMYLKIWVKEKMASPLLFKLQNIIPIDVINLDNKQIEQMILQMESKKIQWSVLGYVSALEQVIRFFEDKNNKGVNANVKSVITMSEGLSEETKKKLEGIFNCSVVSRYSNLENGIIAQQLPNESRFLVNTASYHVEIVAQNSNEVLKDGQLGRIVVTDLFNYAMPMIRYDTGDLGVIEKVGGKTYLQSVEGRKLDVLFDTKGEMVSSYIMYKNMWQYNEIDQYQLIQTHEKAYEFKINCSAGFHREAQLVSEFKQYLGQDADFKVTYVNEIPLLDSGKRRKTVNLYRKTL